MTCPNCGAGLDDRSRFCNYCGQAQRQPPPECQAQPPAGGPYPGFQPQPPISGGSVIGGEKIHLILSLCCFGWAGLVGLPRCISFVVTLFNWNWSAVSLPISGWFSVGMNFVLPLVAGFILLNMHRQNNA